MQLKKTSIALIVCSLFVSGGVLADVEDSFNMDDSFNHTTSDNGDDGNTLTSTSNSIDDSFNHTSSNDGNDNNSYSNDQEWSNDQDWDMDYTQTDIDTDISVDLDMDTMVATSALQGTLSGVSVSYDSTNAVVACCSTVKVQNSNSLSGFNSAAGITSVAQNVGGNALTQQSVAINAQN